MYPEKVSGWVLTDASRSAATPGSNYENPNGTREFVILGYKRVRSKDTHKVKDRIPYFKYNPHTEPGDRVEVKGFDTVEQAVNYGIAWMRDNPVADKEMGDNSGGLMAFTNDGSSDSDSETSDKDESGKQEKKEIPQIQMQSATILSEYSKSGEYVGESPGARGISRPGEMPAKPEWPDGWVDKTGEFDHYTEGKDDRTRNRKRVVCECGLSMDVTGTCLTVRCYSCGKSLVDLSPADSPGETKKSGSGSSSSSMKGEGKDLVKRGGSSDNKDDTGPDNDDGDEEESSGLQAFVNNNS